MEAVKTEVLDKLKEGLTPGELLEELNRRMNRSVSRSALFRWRQQLRFFTPPFYEDHIESLMVYGNLVGLGMKPQAAHEATKEEIKLRKHAKGEI